MVVYLSSPRRSTNPKPRIGSVRSRLGNLCLIGSVVGRENGGRSGAKRQNSPPAQPETFLTISLWILGFLGWRGFGGGKARSKRVNDGTPFDPVARLKKMFTQINDVVLWSQMMGLETGSPTRPNGRGPDSSLLRAWIFVYSTIKPYG